MVLVLRLPMCGIPASPSNHASRCHGLPLLRGSCFFKICWHDFPNRAMPDNGAPKSIAARTPSGLPCEDVSHIFVELLDNMHFPKRLIV